MVAVTFLHDHEIHAWRSVKDDSECDELLQELREATGENWLIEVRERMQHPSLLERCFGKKPTRRRSYTLYADCHGEWQIINLLVPIFDGTSSAGTVFSGGWTGSREAVMNYMLGILNGLRTRTSVAA